MIDIETAYYICSSMPHTQEQDYRTKITFKAKGKIFVTLNLEQNWCTLKLTAEQQAEFCENAAIFPVPNKWGKVGWTHACLDKIQKDTFVEVVRVAWQNSALKNIL